MKLLTEQANYGPENSWLNFGMLRVMVKS